VINGKKWWTSGAMDPRCKILILMVIITFIHENGTAGDVYFSFDVKVCVPCREKQIFLHLDISSSQ
jgi:hypothetical protein